jgi:hypothetical protein
VGLFSHWQKKRVPENRRNFFIPSLPLTTTFPLWKTTLRPEVTLPSPTKLSLQWDLGSSELVGASMVRSGVWDRKTSGKRSLGLRIPPRGSSRVRLVVRRVLEVQSTSVGSEGCLGAHSGRLHWWPYPLSLLPHSDITHSPGGLKTPSTLLPGSAPQPAVIHTLWGYTALITHLAACTRPQERGAAVSLPLISAPRVHIWASPITTPPPAACRSNIIHLQSGHNRNGCPHFLPHLSFPSHVVVYHPVHFRLLNTSFISPPH